MIEQMEDDDENIFQTSLFDTFAARPTTLNSMCLAKFAANYTTRSGQGIDEESTGRPADSCWREREVSLDINQE